MVSPCGEADILEITVPEGLPTSVDYFLSDTDAYQLPEFTVNYEVCDLFYSMLVIPTTGFNGVSFDNDPEVRELTYSFDLDATYLDTYAVTITVQVA